MRFKDAEAYKNCMEVMDNTEWADDISHVIRFDAYAIDIYLDI